MKDELELNRLYHWSVICMSQWILGSIIIYSSQLLYNINFKTVTGVSIYSNQAIFIIISVTLIVQSDPIIEMTCLFNVSWYQW